MQQQFPQMQQQLPPQQDVNMQQQVPQQGVDMQQQLPQQGVDMQQQLPQQGVVMQQQQLPQQGVGMQQPLPQQGVDMQQQLPQQSVGMQQPLPQQSVDMQKQIPQQGVNMQDMQQQLPQQGVSMQDMQQQPPQQGVDMELPGSDVTNPPSSDIAATEEAHDTELDRNLKQTVLELDALQDQLFNTMAKLHQLALQKAAQQQQQLFPFPEVSLGLGFSSYDGLFRPPQRESFSLSGRMGGRSGGVRPVSSGPGQKREAANGGLPLGGYGYLDYPAYPYYPYGGYGGLGLAYFGRGGYYGLY
jgi:hypothetical protein